MATQESPPLAVGTRLDAYTITEVVEQGRYSHAYSARDAAGTEVLIKEFLPHEFAVRDGDAVRPRDADDKTPLRFWLRSFLDKAVLLQKLNHPGLVRVLKQFEANGTGYYVTERVGVIQRVRKMAVGIAGAWVDQQFAEPQPDTAAAEVAQ